MEAFAPVALAIMATSDWQLPNLGANNKPNQLLQFDFPKREFGKTRVVKRVFQSQWAGKWPWLHYDCSWDLVFCHTCVTTFKTGKLRLTVGNVKDSAFLFTGFSNWKDVTIASRVTRRALHTKER